ncbi:ABC-2 transporter permease [Lysinibacillus sp. G4S2]|uniref:ABC-2 transporter permease n=1 Tax=Lysinibacillus sp. G4S2 TaxID=3055859 RepID=UPI0025A1BFC9|nr:ABC-2 transporter permease [Lysinibacillus sp. G4S2]MDM5246991.1 ABC-2 transporter permease [Lysinibacillus sp. G4S2]
MQALLLQRIMVQKWSILFAAIICMIISFTEIPILDSPSIGIFVVVFSASIVGGIYEDDQKANWELFVNSLPLTRKTQLQADFLYCHGVVILLFILIAPAYFSQTAANGNFSEHFAMYFAYISSASLLISIQFYIHHLDETKRMRYFRMMTAIFLIFIISFPIHYFLSQVVENLLIILIPTIMSIIISIFILLQSLTLYLAREVF